MLGHAGLVKKRRVIALNIIVSEDEALTFIKQHSLASADVQSISNIVTKRLKSSSKQCR